MWNLDPTVTGGKGLSYLPYILVHTTDTEFQKSLADLDTKTLEDHIRYHNTTSTYENHPVGELVRHSRRRGNLASSQLKSLALLVSKGLDLARKVSGKYLYIQVMSSTDPLTPSEKVEVLEAFLAQKAEDPNFVDFFVKIFNSWDIGMGCASVSDIVESTYFNQIGKLPAETRRVIHASLRTNPYLLSFIPLLEALENQPSKFNDFNGLFEFGKRLTESEYGRNLIVQFLSRCDNETRLMIVEVGLRCKNNTALVNLALESLSKPLSSDEQKKLSVILQKYIPSSPINNANMLDTPLWKVHCLFTNDFKMLIPQLTDLNTLRLYFYMLRLQEEFKNQDLKGFYADQVKFFKELGYLSQEAATNLEKPVFSAIQSDNLRTYSKEFLLSLAEVIMQAKTPGMRQEFFHLIYFIIHHLHELGSLIKSLRLESISIYTRGKSTSQWTSLLDTVLGVPGDEFSKKFIRSSVLQFSASSGEMLDLVRYSANFRYIRLQGRTLLFQIPHSDEWLAIKIQKKGEAPADLQKEADMQRWLVEHKNELGLQSDYPVLIQCAEAYNIVPVLDKWLTKNEKDWLLQDLLGSNLDKAQVLIYRAKPGYFTYLHSEIMPETFNAASMRALHDLCVLLKQGFYFDRLADIFHHSWEQDRASHYTVRYRALTDIISRISEGGGRLASWLRAVEYVNLRSTGFADFGDVILIVTEIFRNDSASGFIRKFMEDLKSPNDYSRIVLNCIAEYLYVFFLVAGRRARIHTLGVKPETAAPLWKSHAELILKLCAHALHVFTDENEEKLYAYLFESIDLTRLARQMQFWMTNEYIPYVKNNTIPPDIFGSGVEVEIDFNKFREGTFNDLYGCCVYPNHGPDLGTVNGQEPLKEMNKLLYVVAMTVYSVSNCKQDASFVVDRASLKRSI